MSSPYRDGDNKDISERKSCVESQIVKDNEKLPYLALTANIYYYYFWNMGETACHGP